MKAATADRDARGRFVARTIEETVKETAAPWWLAL
jgi:hypothetical protein